MYKVLARKAASRPRIDGSFTKRLAYIRKEENTWFIRALTFFRLCGEVVRCGDVICKDFCDAKAPPKNTDLNLESRSSMT